MKSLPEGWVVTKLPEFAEIIMGQSPSSSDCNELGDGLPFFQGKAEFTDLYPQVRKYCTQPKKLAEKHDVLLSVRAPVGPTNLAKEQCVIGRGLSAIRATEQADKYLLYYFRSIEPWMSEQGTGSTFKAISGQFLKDLDVKVAPLPEQKRIVAKLDEVLAQVDTIKARLDGIPAILKRFRQSVLAAAVSGKLTEEWRGHSNASSEVDLELELLENKNKPRKVEKTSNHELVVSNFPKVWRKSTFTELYKFIDYRGKTPKKSDEGYRLYTAKNIKMGFISNEPVEYLSEKDFATWMTRGFSRLGDIFFVTEGHTMGCTAINELGSDIALAQRTLTLQPYGKVNTRFHHYYMMSESFQKLVDLNATGSAAKGIKAAKFRGLPLPFPSYEEQKEIVRLVDQYFAFADTIEAQVKKAQGRVDNLTQSILAKAFRGELVPQDSADEPAEVLLERIAQARKETEALAKAAKKAAKAPRKTAVKE